MNTHLLFRLMHLAGVVLWIGPTVAVALMVALSSDKTISSPARKAVLWLGTPGLVLAWIGGLGMLLPAWSEVYARAGWMHIKLTLAVLVTGVTGAITGQLRRTACGQAEPDSGKMGRLATAALTLALVVM